MSEMIEMSVGIHLLLIFATLMVVFIGYKNTTNTNKPFAKKANFAKYLRPQYNLVLAALFFTGIIVMAVKHFVVSIDVVLMVVAWLYMIVSDIKRGKLLAKTNFKDEKSQKIYLDAALKKHHIDFAIIVAVGIISYFIIL